LHVAFEVGFSTCGFCEYGAADVTGYSVGGVAEDKLLVATFGAFNPQESAVRFGDKFIPFRHYFFLLYYG
jgi:hypothetical protein